MAKKTCPSCNGKNIAKIFWGLPADTDWYLKSIDEKKIVGGGCCVSPNDPKLECTDCGTRWR
jgi:hypothetical protein